MNTYDKIYNLILEEAFLVEQKKGRAGLMATAGLLGAMTAGLQSTGKETPPAPIKPASIAKTTTVERPTIPRVNKRTSLGKPDLSKVKIDGKALDAKLKNMEKQRKEEGQNKASRTRQEISQDLHQHLLQRSIDDRQKQIDHDNIHGRRKQ